MRVCSVADGRLLGDRLLSYGSNIAATGGDVSDVGHTEYSGCLRLLHERHYNGVHRRFGPCNRY